jgi:hypothetical protein
VAKRKAVASHEEEMAMPIELDGGGAGYDERIQSRTLTAGSFDDGLNPGTFESFAHGLAHHSDLAQWAERFLAPRTVIRVQDDKGRPIGDAEVTFRGAGRRDSSVVRSGTDGRAIHMSGLDGGGRGTMTVEVTHHGHRLRTTIPAGSLDRAITMPTQAKRPSRLDIALVIDTTGSMSDELEYLKVEVRNIAESISREFPGVDQRYALVAYRDRGDEYVTRVHDFSSLRNFRADLGAQSAGGGGDYPEAMHRALESANELSWRNGNTARMTFLIADAPPHGHEIAQTFDALDELRHSGVALYPVAASGVAQEAEFIMRTSALASGGEYIFLTDDSGVGNSHAEPHIPCYQVEHLKDAMVRVVRSELAGHRVESDPRAVVRSVGNSKHGVCQQGPARGLEIAH